MRKSLAALAVAWTLGAGCAPLFLAGKSESCRRLYDSCLNGCPQPRKDTDPYTHELQMDVAACTEQCNEQARACK